jgi:hypothetical protein
MARRIKGLIISRLIVLISVILVPIVIFLIFAFTPFELAWIPDENIKFWLLKVIIPIIFSVSWVYFLILFANRTAASIDMMDKTIGVVPLRLKFFYGLNAVFILLIFIYPLITPIFATISFASFGWRLSTMRVEDWSEKEKTSTLTKVLIVLFCIPPVICGIIIVPEIYTLSYQLWSNVWIPMLEYIYIVSNSLCTALAFGSLIILFKTSGVSEYEQFYVKQNDKSFFRGVIAFEAFLTGFFLFLEWFQIGVVNLFYYAGFFIVLFVAVANLIKGKMQNKSFKSYFFGYLIAIVFMGSSILIALPEYFEIGTNLKNLSLIISAAAFILIFFITFLRIENIE